MSADDFVSMQRAELERIAVKLGVPPRLAAMIGAEWDVRTRRDWGRCEPYIAVRAPISTETKAMAIAEVRRTGKVDEAATRWGVPRSSLYRLMNINLGRG